MDNKLIVTMESPVKMAGGGGEDSRGDNSDEDAAIRGMAVVRTELVVRDVTPAGSAGSKSGVPTRLTAEQLEVVMQRSAMSVVADVAVSVWEGFTGTGYDADDAGESLLERMRKFRGGDAAGQAADPGHPEVLQGYGKGRKNSGRGGTERDGGGESGDDDAGEDKSGAWRDGQANRLEDLAEKMYDAVPLLEADVLSVEFAVRKPQADGSLGPVQEIRLPVNRDEPIGCGVLMEALSANDDDDGELVPAGVANVLKNKLQALADQASEQVIARRLADEVPTPGRRDSYKPPRSAPPKQGRVIDAAFHERR